MWPEWLLPSRLSPEHRQVVTSESEGSPKGGAKAKAKAKAGHQAKGIVEDTTGRNETAVASASAPAGSVSGVSQEALVAEVAKILKNVTLKPIRLEAEPDLSWLQSALTSASDPDYCLVDSGATNALRPAGSGEIEGCKVIRIDLASTLLHMGPCQVILPASCLLSLGYGISWKRRGCKIKHPKSGSLAVTVVKGCPLIPRQVGLELLRQYELSQTDSSVLKKIDPGEVQGVPSASEARAG